MRNPVMLSILLPAVLATSAEANTIHLAEEVIEGNPVALRIEGFDPGERITLELRRIASTGALAESRVLIDVGADGVLDPAVDTALEGSYRGTDAAGPFWAMQPSGRSDSDRGSLTVRAKRGDALLAERTVRLLPFASHIAVEEIGEFAGARLYRPRGDDALPLVIVLGGSEGGSATGRALAPRFAELGYAALALPYYNPPWTGEDLPGLPQAFLDIPAERLAAVRGWAERRADIAADRIAVYGVSKGGEFAMLAAARFPWLRAAIGIVPSDVVWEGWGSAAPEGTTSSFSWQGAPLDFVPYLGMSEAIDALSRGENRPLTVPHLEGRRANPDRAARARIPVERFAGAILVAGGDRDSTWPSGEMVRAIAERRAEAGRATTALSFADAGHGLAGTGWNPLNYVRADPTVAANAAAQQKIWPATVAFLAEQLGRAGDPPR